MQTIFLSDSILYNMNDFNKVSTLRERNYELQRQLADISNATVKKFTKKTPELPIVETRKKRISSGTPQSVADIASRDLAFQIQLDDITDKAVARDQGVVPTKVNREITQEMILDFQEAQRVPVVTPDGTEYKYRPSGVDITLKKLKIPHVDIPQFASVDVINKIREEYRRDLNAKYNEDNDNLYKIVKEKRENKRIYNETNAQLKADRAGADAAGVKAIDAELLNLSSKYLGGLKRLDNEIKRLGTEMTNIEGALASLDANFDALVLKFEDNENEKNRVNAINKDKIGAYIQDIQTLNADLNIVRNIGESDEEFAQRLDCRKN
jgi:hypothetical protein